MIRRLAFEPQGRIVGGRTVRKCRFERRSWLPIAAACVIANGIRETLAMLVAKPVRVRLMEPVAPEPRAWATLTNGARLYEVRGALNTAAFVLQDADALTLARMIFDESAGGQAPLSRIEEEALGRLVQALSPTLSPVCGKTNEVVALREAAIDLLTFFEVLIEEPAPLRLGVALTRDPSIDAAPLVRPDQLVDVKLRLTAEVAAKAIDASELMFLAPGRVVPLGFPLEGSDRLMLGDVNVTLGTCGARGDRRAFAVSGPVPAAR